MGALRESNLYIDPEGRLIYAGYNGINYIITGVKNGGYNIFLKGANDWRKVTFTNG